MPTRLVDGTPACHRRRGSTSPWPVLILAAAALAGCRPSPSPAPPRVGAPFWIPALPATHETLSAVLAGLPSGDPAGAWRPSTDAALRRYLEITARRGPSSHPELFPSGQDALAYLVDAHVAWALALGHDPRLARSDVARLREVPVTVDGASWSLDALAREVARRAPWEPRLALFLNAGWRGGPPFPRTALEGRALAWQLTLQAERCGSAPGFWTLDDAGRRLALAAYADLIWGLPDDRVARTRRLLDLVPPPGPLRDRIVATCGASLQRCAIAVTPTDTARLFTPAGPGR